MPKNSGLVSMDKKMLCPACKTELVPGEVRHYITLDEHVSGCEDAPKRETVVCPNRECTAHKRQAFWSFEGEGPYTPKYYGDDSVYIDGNPNPFNSWFRQSWFNIYYDAEDTRIKLTKHWTLQVRVTYKSNDFGDKVGKKRNWSLIKDGVYYANGLRMLIFSLGLYYKQKKWNNNAAAELASQAHWPDAEWWRKVAAWWVHTFHAAELVDDDN